MRILRGRRTFARRLTQPTRCATKCNDAVIVTGVTRSGTTIMGQLIHSLESVAYVYEPPMLSTLLALLDRLSRNEWKLLYEAYLVNDFLFNALAGRGLNTNTKDDSSIYGAKDEAWIRLRLSRTLRKQEVDKEMEGARIAYKLPDIAPFIPKIQEYYPSTAVVMMLRNANDVFRSILQRGWFSDEVVVHQIVATGPAVAVWPSYVVRGLRIPYWVAPGDVEYWVRSDELSRIAYYYVRAHQGMEKIKNLRTVKYDQLVQEPERVFRDLAESLGLRFGPKTYELLASVRKRSPDGNERYVEKLSGKIKERVLYYSRLAEV